MTNVIHIITTIERGGAENQLFILVNEQIASNLEVGVIYLKGKAELEREMIASGVNVISDVANAPVLTQVLRLKKILRQHKGVVHAHLPRAELLTKSALGKKSFVITRHNTEPFFPKAPEFVSRILSRWSTSQTNSIIAISEAVKIYLRSSLEISKKKEIFVVPYGYVKNTKFDKSRQLDLIKKYGLNRKDFVVGTIGRLTQQKNYPTMLVAFKLFSKYLDNAKILIIGVGHLEKELKDFALELGISEKVIWVGKTSEINDHLKLMNLFVLSSYYEGFGLVLLEAMNARIPIIASNSTAIPEVLSKNHPGLCDSSSSMDFFHKMKMSLDPSWREKVIDLQDKQLLQFSPNVMQSKVLEIYNCLNSDK